ncbi:LysR family transcriptional regulator [Sphingomonas sp. OTU376]|uniref:LysR family transcriptional regulator n=1 Tax=Sphingomonas sp. OTU376 TaxID=3043863 RepID=UPI00313B6C43
MDVERLRAFLQIADIGHFGQAAEKLHITQPGLTKRLRALEDQIGARLIDRDWQPARLTPVGRSLLPHARRLVREADTFLQDARRSVSGETGILNLGFGLSTLTVAPMLIAGFRASNPDVAIAMDDYSSQEQMLRLYRDEIDLGFMRKPPVGGLEFMPLADDRLAIAYTGDTATSEPDPLAFSSHNFIALREERGPGLADQIRRWCGRAGFLPRVVQEADDIQTILALVSAGLGAAIVPASSGSLLSGKFKLLPLDGEAASWTVGAAWMSARATGALGRLVRHIQMHVAKDRFCGSGSEKD